MYGEMDWDESLVFFTTDMYFKGMDSITYRIIDTGNMLMSELGTVYLHVDNKGFGFLK